MIENTNPGDYVTEVDDQLMQMILNASAREAMMRGEGIDNSNDERLLEQAIQESLQENPNPDVMSYEQLQELGEKMGEVSKGYTPHQISRLRAKANFDYQEDCAICIEKMGIVQLIKKLGCGHVFHADCIDKSLENSKKCPC
jgi:hypothetical protein